MGLIYTLLASTGELLWIWGLKHQYRVVVVGAWALGSVIAGFFLNRALLILDSSSVYPLWVSIGSVGALLMGAYVYGERLSRAQLGWVVVLVTGCVGLAVGG